MDRGQAALSVVEAGIGILLVLTVTLGFAFGVASPAADSTQLDAYARDALTILQNEQPRHVDRSRLRELTRSPAAFDRERGTLGRRVERILPENVLFRVETDHGALGYRVPGGVPTGTATVTTGRGTATIRVWYA
jgi:hypothetical protein